MFRSRNNNRLYTSQWWCTPTWFFSLCVHLDVLSLRIIASVIYLHVHNAYLLAGLSYSAHILWICLRTCIWCPRINTYKSLFYDSYLSLANNLSVSYVLPLSYTYLEIYVLSAIFLFLLPASIILYLSVYSCTQIKVTFLYSLVNRKLNFSFFLFLID